MALRLELLDVLCLVFRQDTGDDLGDVHAAADGLRRARIIARQHDNIDAHRAETGDGLAARRLLHVSSGEDADHAVVFGKDQRRTAVIRQRGQVRFIRCKVDSLLRHELVIAGRVNVAVGLSFNTTAKERLEIRHGLRCDAPLPSCRHHGLCQRMLTALLEARGNGEELLLRDAVDRRDIRDHRTALRDRASLIHDDCVDGLCDLERLARLDEDAVLCPLARTDHDGDRRREAQGAGARDDENADGNRERELDARAHGQPGGTRQHGNRDDRWHKDASNLVSHARNRCLRGTRLVDEADDLADRRVLADALRAEMDGSLLVDCGRSDLVARLFLDRDRLTRDGRLIDACRARKHDTICRDALTRAHDDLVARHKLLSRNGLLHAAAHDTGLLRREVHELLERLARLPFRARLEVLADGDECDDHASRLKVEIRAVLLHECHVAVAEAPAHAEDGEGAEERCRHRTHADEAVHVRRAAEEIAEPRDVVAAVEVHNRQHEQELREGKYDGIFRAVKDRADNLRHGQPEELLKEAVHRDVHRRQQKGNGPDEAVLHLVNALLDRIFLRRGFGRRLLALDRGAVTSVDDGLDDGRHARLRLIVFELHAVRQQIDADIFRAVNLRDGLLHTGRACRTRHARDRKLLFLHLGIEPPWWLWEN